jgi:hypothetical protein
MEVLLGLGLRDWEGWNEGRREDALLFDRALSRK